MAIKHGMRKSKEYKHWLNIRHRCFNEKSHNYKYYGGKGISMAKEFVNDFSAFYNEIGPIPDDIGKWTVDRVDNCLGYIHGNMRWAKQDTQSRNKNKYTNNSSGFTGVYWTVVNNNTNAVASWNEFILAENRYTQRSKHFAVRKYGLLPAFALACEYRTKKINALINEGYGYTENHGK